MQKIDHYIRFGSHKESKILMHKYVEKNVPGLTINANVIAHTPASICRLIYVKFPRTKFFIDPQTYIVQLDPIKYYSSEKTKNGEKIIQIKSSVQTLLSQYGKPVSTIIDTMKEINYSDLNKKIGDLTEKVIHFQRRFLTVSIIRCKRIPG